MEVADEEDDDEEEQEQPEARQEEEHDPNKTPERCDTVNGTNNLRQSLNHVYLSILSLVFMMFGKRGFFSDFLVWFQENFIKDPVCAEE